MVSDQLKRWTRKFCGGIYRTFCRPKPIKDDEVVARFVYDPGDIKTSTGTVKAGAFLPNPKDWKTSVFRKSRMSESYYAEIKQETSSRRKRRIKGTALFHPADVPKSELKLVPEESEFRWHADICGWPPDKSKKAEQKLLAGKLAMKAWVE